MLILNKLGFVVYKKLCCIVLVFEIDEVFKDIKFSFLWPRRDGSGNVPGVGIFVTWQDGIRTRILQKISQPERSLYNLSVARALVNTTSKNS